MPIEGLTSLTQPGLPNAARMIGNKFSLPAGFPREHFSSLWAEEGNGVLEAMQDEYIEATQHKAIGWVVYKEKKITYRDVEVKNKQTGLTEIKQEPDKTEDVPVKKVVGKKTYVLMVRPKRLQQAVNALYAKTSRDMVNREIKGETNGANLSGDEAILTNADLRRAERMTGEDVTLLPSVDTFVSPDDALHMQLG